jgi:hypothetical protein
MTRACGPFLKERITIRQIRSELREEDRRLDRKGLRRIPLSADKVPLDHLIVHNSVIPDAWTPFTPLAVHGFRAWTQIATDKIEACSCRWAPWLGPHYRVAGAKPPQNGDHGIFRPLVTSRGRSTAD